MTAKDFHPDPFVVGFFRDLAGYAGVLEHRTGAGHCLLLDNRDRRGLVRSLRAGVTVDWWHFRGLTVLWSDRPI